MIQFDKISISSLGIWRRNLRCLGFTLIIIGVPFGLICDIYIANIGWNSFFMPIALLLLPKWKRLLTLRFPAFNSLFLLTGIYIFSVWIYMALLPYGDFAIRYWIFVTVMYFEIMTLKSHDVDFNKVISYTFLFGIVVLLGTLFCEIGEVWQRGDSEEAALGRLTMGSGCVTAIIATLMSKSKFKYWSIIQIVIVLLLFTAISFNEKRTPLLVGIAFVIIYLFRYRRLNLFKILGIGVLCFVIGSIIISTFTDFNLVGKFQETLDRSFSGIYDMVYGTSKSGKAAVMRYYTRNWALRQIDDFTWLEYILGQGVMTKWLDIPILQAYIDMGIIGIILFGGLLLVYPIYCLFSKVGGNRYVFFCVAVNLYTVLSIFNSGYPYTIVKWCPVMILILVMRFYKRSITERN